MKVLKPALFAAFVCGVFRRVGSPLDMFSVGKAAFLLRGSVYVLMGWSCHAICRAFGDLWFIIPACPRPFACFPSQTPGSAG